MAILQELDGLRAAVRGAVVAEGDPEYDDARAVYNAMIDKRPALIVRCADAADVRDAIAFGRREALPIAIRGGGHNAAGLGSVDGGIVIDLSPMSYVHVDAASKTVTAGGGATLGAIDHATHAYGLAVPMGVLSTTGIGGLTLGGGIGYLSRTHGLSIDNLIGVDMVLADGRLVRATEDENADLFWAIRGGGGNFGVVTAFAFRAHEHSTVVGGPMLWDLDAAPELLAFFDSFIDSAPDEVGGFFAFVTVPPGPPFPEHLHLKKMCGIVWCYTGDAAGAAAALAPARAFATPALDGVMELPLPALNSAFDPLFPAGLQSYWKGDFVTEIPAGAIAAHVEHGAEMPTMLSTMHLYPIDGAAGRVAQNATAFSYRDARYSQVILGADPEPAKAAELKRWVNDYWNATHPFATAGGGGYVNFQSDVGDDRVRAAYRGNYDRLVEVKRAYDPENVFRVNWNIRPE